MFYKFLNKHLVVTPAVTEDPVLLSFTFRRLSDEPGPGKVTLEELERRIAYQHEYEEIAKTLKNYDDGEEPHMFFGDNSIFINMKRHLWERFWAKYPDMKVEWFAIERGALVKVGDKAVSLYNGRVSIEYREGLIRTYKISFILTDAQYLADFGIFENFNEIDEKIHWGDRIYMFEVNEASKRSICPICSGDNDDDE